MMKLLIWTLSTLLALGALIHVPSANGKEKTASYIMSYDEKILDAFFQSAPATSTRSKLFEKSILNRMNRSIHGLAREDKAYIERIAPWLSPFLEFPSGAWGQPRITMRTKPVIVAVGFPDYEDAKIPKSSTAIAEALAVSKRQLIREIEGLTNLSFQIREEFDKNSTLVPNLRIVPVTRDDASYWQTDYREGDVTSFAGRIASILRAEDRLPSRIEFTPELGLYQVKGYNIANQEGEIVYSTCYIIDDLEPSLLVLLVNECILRSLGFPGVQHQFRESLLYLWNASPISQDSLAEAQVSIPEAIDDEHQVALLIHSIPAFLALRSGSEEELSTGLLEVDRSLIGLLYSSDVTPGDTIIDAYIKLISKSKGSEQ